MEFCRLCLSMAPAEGAHYIFTPQTDLYLKILACLPLKVSKIDKLPKIICNACLTKVDDYFNFCCAVIEVENQLHNFRIEVKDDFDYDSAAFEDFPDDITLSERRSIFKFGKIMNAAAAVVDSKPETFPIEDAKRSTAETQTQTDPAWCGSPDVKQEAPLKAEAIFEVPVLKRECEDHAGDAPKPKRSRKDKGLKLSIKRSATSYSVARDDPSDSEDKISLKELQSLKNRPQIKVELSDVENDYDADDPENFTIKTEEELYNCCICFERCFTKADMLSHYRSHIPDNPFLNLNFNENGEEIPKESFPCFNCNQVFKSQNQLSKHLTQKCVIKPYRCTLCEKTFKTPQDILKHGAKFHNSSIDNFEMNAMGKRFMCDVCDEVFVYMKYLMIHRNTKHPEMRGKELVNRCMHCRREFAHLNSLRRHLRSHSGEKNFLCNVCGKSLSSREHLKFHIRIHTGFKPNICKTCGKGFVKKCNLTLHERVHSGERPHVCSHCGKAFSQKSTLVIHERYHSGARPYVCTICSKGFVAKGLLSMHLKTCCV